MTFVDTGFLLALVQPADALHSRATVWAQRATRPLLVTETVFDIAIGVFASSFS
jgi:predicted nucleic acid-binding protein